MLNLKKTAVAVLALGSSAVFAGTMGPICTPGNVTVPCPNTGWEIGGRALVMDLTTDNSLALTTDVGPGFFAASSNSSARWKWGFEVEAGYHFNTGNDINISWYHVDTGWNTNVFDLSPLVAGLALETQVKARWDAVNGEFGQFVDFSANKKIRFHGGFQFASLKHNQRAAVDTVADGVFSVAAGDLRNDQYNGFGPRTGIDMNYVFGNGFGIYAKGAALLLAGSAKTNIGIAVPAAPLGVALSASRTKVVPGLDAKLGADYAYAMAQGDLTLDVGYMWFDYINALNPSLGNASGSFGGNGVYFGLTYLGNM